MKIYSKWSNTEQKGARMITLTKLKEKANLLEIDVSMLSLMPMYGMKEKSKEVRVVCKKLQRSISEKNWVDCIVLLGEIEEFERYYRNWLIDRGEEEDDEVLEKMHEYIVDLETGIEKRLREGEEECREEHVELARLKNLSYKDSLRQKFSMNEEI
ncbi:TPA: hypothetical protein TXN47_002330 [Streptococcus suis]|nr:hypothetical protein [Streptococcus suis]